MQFSKHQMRPEPKRLSQVPPNTGSPFARQGPRATYQLRLTIRRLMVWLRNVIGGMGYTAQFAEFAVNLIGTYDMPLGQKFDRHRIRTWQVDRISYGHLWYQSWQSLSDSQANIIHMYSDTPCLFETNCVSKDSQRYFALCDSCFWSVSLLQSRSILHCPICPGQTKLSLIPLHFGECYDIKFSSKGLEMRFGKTANDVRLRE
jgi:hypothetical protein